jgi:hypothetical protein
MLTENMHFLNLKDNYYLLVKMNYLLNDNITCEKKKDNITCDQKCD